MNEHSHQQPEREQRPEFNPRIWIGSLADYNAGHLLGDWIDAAVSADEIQDAVQAILSRSREPVAEEWGIFDYDEFAGYRVGEHEDLDSVARIARGIQEHGPAFAAWARLNDGDRIESYEDAYLGAYDSAVDWAREVLLDQDLEAELDRAVPDSLRSYVSIDYAAFVHDCTLGGDIYVESNPAGGVWIFQGNV